MRRSRHWARCMGPLTYATLLWPWSSEVAYGERAALMSSTDTEQASGCGTSWSTKTYGMPCRRKFSRLRPVASAGVTRTPRTRCSVKSPR